MGHISAYRTDRLLPFLSTVRAVVEKHDHAAWADILATLERCYPPPALDRPTRFWANVEPYTRVSWHTRGSFPDLLSRQIPEPDAPELRWLLRQLIMDVAACRIDLEEPTPRAVFETAPTMDGFPGPSHPQHEFLLTHLFGDGGFPDELECLYARRANASTWLDANTVRDSAELERQFGLLDWLAHQPPEWVARDFGRIKHLLALGAIQGWSLYYVNDK